MSEETQETTEERYKPSKDLVNALIRDYPFMDRFMAETLVSLHDHDALNKIEMGWKDGEKPEPKYEELISIKIE